MVNQKLFGLLFFGNLAALTLPAQESEPALARVIYEFTHINDTLQPDKPHKEEMVLYIGQHTSRYSTYSSERVNQQVKKQLEDPGFDGNITITGSGRTTPESYYAYAVGQQFRQLYSLAGRRYLLEEEYPYIDWQITDEVKDIGGYAAQAATGRFKGRDYIAWFTTDVPFQAGPWKLRGLPGLILEATDSRAEVSFHYAGFETLTEGEAMISLPENVIPTDKKALDKVVDAYEKNPQAFMNTPSKSGRQERAFSISGTNTVIDPSQIKSISVKRDIDQVSAVTNNPLELEN